MRKITLAVSMLTFVAGITLLFFFTKTEKESGIDILTCISTSSVEDMQIETAQIFKYNDENTALAVTNETGELRTIYKINLKDTQIEATPTVQHNENMTLMVTNMIGDIRNIYIDCDTAKYVEFVKIAFAASGRKTPDRVKAIVEVQGETIVVTFVEIYDDICTDGAGYGVVVDVKTKAVLEVFEEPN